VSAMWSGRRREPLDYPFVAAALGAWTIFLPMASYFKGALALSVLGRGYADFRKFPFYDIG
jgi:hypothetical protein